MSELFVHGVARASTREEARAQADRAVEELQGVRRGELGALCEIVFARRLASDGNPVEALLHLEGLDTRLPPWVHALADLARADVYLNLGQYSGAIACIDARARPLQERGFSHHAAIAHLKAARGLRLAGRADEAREQLADADAIAVPLQSDALGALIRIERARLALVTA